MKANMAEVGTSDSAAGSLDDVRYAVVGP
jgi:hypothetical protein